MRTFAGQLIRNPVLQFILLGAGAFGLNDLARQDHLAAQPENIIIKDSYVQTMVDEVESRAMREITPEQKRKLIEKAIEKEVLFREALSRRMDKGDVIIRRHLIQKMEFVLDARSEPEVPEPEALHAWWEAHRDQYRNSARVSFNQVFFLPESDKQAAFEEKLRIETPDPETAHRHGDSFLRGHHFDNARIADLPRVFGPELSEQLSADNTEQWLGPIKTRYGAHYIYLDEYWPAGIKSYEQAYAQVYSDFMEHRREQRKQRFIDEIRNRYTVVFDGEDELAAN